MHGIVWPRDELVLADLENIGQLKLGLVNLRFFLDLLDVVLEGLELVFLPKLVEVELLVHHAIHHI